MPKPNNPTPGVTGGVRRGLELPGRLTGQRAGPRNPTPGITGGVRGAVNAALAPGKAAYRGGERIAHFFGIGDEPDNAPAIEQPSPYDDLILSIEAARRRLGR